MSLLHVSLGDPAAGIVGQMFGRHRWNGGKHGGKSVEGTAGAFIACLLASGTYLAVKGCWDGHETATGTTGVPHMFTPAGIVMVVWTGAAGALAEGFSVFNLNDNLTIPIMSGLFMLPLSVRVFASTGVSGGGFWWLLDTLPTYYLNAVQLRPDC